MAAIPLSVSFWVNHWDSKEAWLCVARSSAKPTALISLAGQGLLVPRPHFAELEEVGKMGEMAVQRVVVQGAPAPRDPAQARGPVGFCNFPEQRSRERLNPSRS